MAMKNEGSKQSIKPGHIQYPVPNDYAVSLKPVSQSLESGSAVKPMTINLYQEVERVGIFQSDVGNIYMWCRLGKFRKWPLPYDAIVGHVANDAAYSSPCNSLWLGRGLQLMKKLRGLSSMPGFPREVPSPLNLTALIEVQRSSELS